MTTESASQTSTAAERTVLQRCGPVGATPDGRPPEVMSSLNNEPQSISRECDRQARAGISRALVPMGRDPLEVEVNDRPQDVSDPCAIVLFGLNQPLRILEKDIRAEGRAICTSLRTNSKTKNMDVPAAGEPMRVPGSTTMSMWRSNTASSRPPVNTSPERLFTCCVLVSAWTTSSICGRRLMSLNTVSSLSHGW
jgi:hypothetical protein